MSFETAWPATIDLLETFTEELTSADGKVTDKFDDGQRLYVRSVLPGLREVRRGDGLQGGVAMRATEREIQIHPYVFRLVCSNGAIFAQVVQSRFIVRDDEPADVLFEAREAIRACCADEAFANTAEQTRSTAHAQANHLLNIMPLLARMGRHMPASAINQILRTFDRDGDRSAYGVMNAVTATARDTRDPEVRWRLEELGGGIPALIRPTPWSPSAAMTPPQRTRRRETVTA